ncbi:hypothetical protein K5Y32_08785 [Pantoea sp. DY-15]|uniref:hypothetical protein n=1 Tax=Pantoea sp. DY-15 TaxID=2871489 RepID=UPI001C956239|nr:hypothetical protein [Pantoea sp. DY-15]MBY4888031.1 hypothetical protein [Pantoea sp. DY-15]
MRNIICSFDLTLGMTSITTSAQANTLTQTLTRRDASCFSEIYHQLTSISRVAPLMFDQQHHAWFKAPQAII